MEKLKIKDLPFYERPRERLMREGPKALTNAELLAIILGNGTYKENVIDLSRRLFLDYNLNSLASKKVSSFKKIFGIGEVKACKIVACFELSRRYSSFKNEPRPHIKSTRGFVKIIKAEISDPKKEHFIGIYLDSRKRIIKKEVIFIGTLNANMVHPREIFKIALQESAAEIIIAHNHPSDDPEPSEDDIKITEQLVNAGSLLGINVVDHIIVCNDSFFSFKSKGYL